VVRRGIVAPGEVMVHDFRVRNDGDAALTLRPRPRSRAMAVEPTALRIAPGEVGRVRVIADTWELRGPAELIASATTDDPDRPELVLRLGLDVRPFVLARPGSARFVLVRGAEGAPLASLLWPADGVDFRILGVEAPHPHIRVRHREAAPAERASEVEGRQWVVEAAVVSDAPVGPLTGFIAVRLDHPRQREVRIPLSGFVRPTLAVTPPAIALGDVDGRAPRRLVLSVRNFGDEPVDLQAVASDVPGIATAVVPVERGRRYRLEVVTGPEIPEGAFTGTISIRTSTPRQPVVEVPVTGRGVGQ
jgi:hypothetical protein